MHNNWLTTNLSHRCTNPKLNFLVDICPYPVKILNFDDECNITAKIIANFNKKIYIGLSGGIDSEFVCEVFLKNKIDFIPIIVCYDGNEEERAYAFKYCKEKQIKPIIIEITEKQIVNCIWNTLVKKFNGIGIYSVGAIIAAEYAENNNGIFVEAEHFIGDGLEEIQDFKYYIPEWDFYTSVLFPKKVFLFFLYRLELCHAMIKTIDIKHNDWMTYKHIVYNRPLRPKMKPSYSRIVNKIIKLINCSKKNIPTSHYFIGNKIELIKKLSCS
jgi:hypothetical protein